MKGKPRSVVEKDAAREERIDMEIVVDAYDEVERAMGWYCHLENEMKFPFAATLRGEGKGHRSVVVKGLSDSDDCLCGMRVEVEAGGYSFDAALEDVVPGEVDAGTRRAIEDWQYWVGRRYGF
jgi:hypothetical protein